MHLGCGNGELTAALRVNKSYQVHGIDARPTNVAQARQYVKGTGNYGAVSIDRLMGDKLPYIDNFVNLLVAERLEDVSMDEVMRVLAPHGVAYIGRDGQWTKTIKPRPKNIDEWDSLLSRRRW